MPKGERERGCEAGGRGEMVVGACVDCEREGGMDMERSEVGVLSSTAEDEGCWLVCRVVIWSCCRRIMLSRRLTCPSCSYSSSWCSSPRLGARSWWGLCGQGPRLRDEGLSCISPGAGTAGSLRLRCMRTLERRRARSTSRRMLPADGRRESSCWMPAFMAAVAASECGEAAMARVAEGEWVREVPLAACGEGGRVLRSGGMVLRSGGMAAGGEVTMTAGGVRLRAGGAGDGGLR